MLSLKEFEKPPTNNRTSDTPVYKDDSCFTDETVIGLDYELTLIKKKQERLTLLEHIRFGGIRVVHHISFL